MHAFNELEALLINEGLGEVVINQCEVVYVNPLPVSMTGVPLSAPQKIFRVLNAASGEEWKECMQTPEVAMLSYSNLRAGQLVEGLDEFYKDFRNKNILVDVAIRYVKDELRGKTGKELEDELATFRKAAK